MQTLTQLITAALLLATAGASAAAPRHDKGAGTTGPYSVVAPYSGGRSHADDRCTEAQTDVVCDEDAAADATTGALAVAAIATEELDVPPEPPSLSNESGIAGAMAELQHTLPAPSKEVAQLHVTVHYRVNAATAMLQQPPSIIPTFSEANANLLINVRACPTCAPTSTSLRLADDDGASVTGAGSASFVLAKPAGGWTSPQVFIGVDARALLDTNSMAPRRAEAQAHVDLVRIDVEPRR